MPEHKNFSDDIKIDAPFSNMVLDDNYVFLSGLVAADVEAGLAVLGDIRAETEMVMATIKFLLGQVVGVSIILLFLMKGFTAFLYFATSVGFIAAPAVAYYNYVAMTSDDVPAEFRPGRRLMIWNWISVVVMTLFALAFIYISLS